MHLLFSVIVGFTIAGVDHLIENRREVPNRELIHTWKAGGFTVSVYRNNQLPLFASPSIDILHERLVLPYVMMVRPIASFTKAGEALGTIDATGVLHVRVPPLDAREPAREQSYHLRPWVWF